MKRLEPKQCIDLVLRVCSYVAPPESEHPDQGRDLKFGSIVDHEGVHNALMVNAATEKAH